MGKSILAFFQSALDFIAPKSEIVASPKVNGYVADYTPLSNEEIAAPAACDDVFKTGNWVPVNRRVR